MQSDVDRLYDTACATAAQWFTAEQAIDTLVLFSPAADPQALVPLVLSMPEPGTRQAIWRLLRLALTAHDAASFACISEVWAGSAPTEWVSVMLIWRSAAGPMQRIARWPILRDGAGARLGTREDIADTAAQPGNIAACLPPQRLTRQQRRIAQAAWRSAQAAWRKLLATRSIETMPIDEETVH